MNPKTEVDFEELQKLGEERAKMVAEKDGKRQAYSSISDMFGSLLATLKNAKPGERSEEARRFAVTITELEKVDAYFDKYIKDAI